MSKNQDKPNSLKYIYLFLVIGILFYAPALINTFKINLFNATTAKEWFQLEYKGNTSDALQDHIPDGWTVALWDQGLAAYKLDTTQYFHGKASVFINKNTENGRAMLKQDFSVPGNTISCGVFHKGDKGFFRLISDHLLGRETITLPQAEDWTYSSMDFNMSAESSTATLLLGIGSGKGEIWFDEIHCYLSNSDDTLLVNGDFEKDGKPYDPIAWWVQILSYQNLPANYGTIVNWVRGNTSLRISDNFLNAANLMIGNFDDVTVRMTKKSNGCYHNEGSPSILLSLSSRFQPEGGLELSERLAELGTYLMPNCPQSYAFLGSLYQSVNSYNLAAYYYGEAARRSQPGAQKGAYLFEQGRLHVIGTGDSLTAISVLKQALENKGWERSPWYRGAALIELGNAYFQAGLHEQAREAYQKVINCGECYARQPAAISGLQALEIYLP
jgi:tetratricopeptide (TPR) repeat protein